MLNRQILWQRHTAGKLPSSTSQIRRSNPFRLVGLMKNLFSEIWFIARCSRTIAKDRENQTFAIQSKLPQRCCHLKALETHHFKRLPPNKWAFFLSSNFYFWSGLPTAVKNCTYSNQTQMSVEIHCIAGYDGGLPQYFVLELVSAQTNRVRWVF